MLYQRFLQDCSTIDRLDKKDTVFQWSPDCNQAFEFLKDTFIKTPVLGQFDTDHEIVLACDASGWCRCSVAAVH